MDMPTVSLSESFWQRKQYNKGDVYNAQRSVCKFLGFVADGIFRSYIIDENGDEKNVFFYSKHQFVVSFKSFILQAPCDYHTDCLSAADIWYIRIDHLQELYAQSHAWERFGRLLAQAAFNVAMEKTEGLLFKSPEQRYLDLLQQHPEVFNSVPLYQLSSYLGIQGPSLSRIRKRLSEK